MKYQAHDFSLDSCIKFGTAVYVKGKKNFKDFIEYYKDDIKEKKI